MKGWNAIRRDLAGDTQHKKTESYIVLDCPEHVPEESRTEANVDSWFYGKQVKG